MTTFFSGTDWENLEDRACVSNYFLMLIVNFTGKYCAKVAFKAKRTGKGATKLSFANNTDRFKPITLDGTDDVDVLVVMNCDISIEENITVPKPFEERYEKVKTQLAEDKRKEAEEKKGTMMVHPKYNQGKLWDEQYEYTRENGWTPIPEEREGKKNRRINEMTEKEWLQAQEEDEEAMKIFQRDMGGRGVIVFEQRHARAIINSILAGSYLADDYRDCREALVAKDRQLKSDEQLWDFMQGFQTDLQDHYEVLYCYNDNDTDYVSLMKELEEYLLPYKYIRLVAEMLECVGDEIRMIVEDTPNFETSNNVL